MAGAVVGGIAGGQLPARTVPGGTVGASPSTAPPVVKADAAPPVWQPWVATEAEALSRLKTEIQRSLTSYDRLINEAGRLLDAARAVATAETARLEQAALTAYTAHMTQAHELYNSVMEPALKAYSAAIAEAHRRLTTELNPVQHAYARAKADGNWTAHLPDTATLT